VVSDYDSFDGAAWARSSEGGFVLSGKVAGQWSDLGTAFLRASQAAATRPSSRRRRDRHPARRVAASCTAGGVARDKTLLDALVPAIDTLETGLARPEAAQDHGAQRSRRRGGGHSAAEATKPMLPCVAVPPTPGAEHRVVDAGATAVGVILQSVSAAWREKYPQKETGR